MHPPENPPTATAKMLLGRWRVIAAVLSIAVIVFTGWLTFLAGLLTYDTNIPLFKSLPLEDQLSIMRGIRAEVQAIYFPNLICLLAWLGLLVAEWFWKRR